MGNTLKSLYQNDKTLYFLAPHKLTPVTWLRFCWFQMTQYFCLLQWPLCEIHDRLRFGLRLIVITVDTVGVQTVWLFKEEIDNFFGLNCNSKQ